jgi:hypothetical protein
MPATTRNASNRGGSSGANGMRESSRGGKSAAAAGASSKRSAPVKGKKKAPPPPRSPSPVEEEEEEEEATDDEQEEPEVEVLFDVPTPKTRKAKDAPPNTKKRPMTAREQERLMAQFEEEFRESRRQDATNPSIRVTSISHSAWPSTQTHLDLNEANWKPWSQTLFDVVQSTPPLSLHLMDEPSPPDPSLQPVALRNWNLNDGVVIAQIRLHVTPSERDFIDSQDFKTARQLYDLLRTRHTKLGLSTQVSLINDALASSFSSKVRVSETLKDLKDLNDRIWQIGQPTIDGFLSILVLHNIHPIRDLHRDIENGLATIPNYSITNITKRLSLYESVHQSNLPKSSDPLISTANIASSSRPSQRSHKPQPTCDNCNYVGHTKPYCTKPGGGCEGLTWAQAAAKRNYDVAMAPTGGRPAKPAKAALSVQTAQIATVEEVTEEVTNIATLQTDSIYSLIEASMSAADHAEYNDAWLTTIDLMTGIDWSKFSRDSPESEAMIAHPVAGRRFNTVLDLLTWFLDTCASIHVSHERSDFFELRPLSSPHIVKGIGGSHITAVGIGSIRLKLAKGSVLTLHDVLFIPNATARLISVARLLKSTNWHAVLTPTAASLRNASGAVMATGSLHAGRSIYKLDLSCVEVARQRLDDGGDVDNPGDTAFIASRLPTIDTWHRRLGHANNKAVLDLATKGLVTGMDIDLSTTPPDCDACKKGKQKRTPVPSVRQGEKASQPLQMIYVDLSGPHVKSASGNSYTLDILDDCSSAPWAIPTKNKSQALELLQAWIARIETRTKRRVGTVRIDNGELKSAKFDKFCGERGITLEYTAPYTSAHNGRVERLHHSLMSKARTMSECNNFPSNRWDELYVTAAYLHARTPSASLAATPYKLFWGKKPDVSHLREVGSRAFVFI